MNMQKAIGSGGLPIITEENSGSVQLYESNYSNSPAIAHACIMVLTFFGLMPLGLLILRILGSVKWHAINQAVATTLAIIGAALGIYISTMYNRSKNFNSAHQVLGIMIILGVIVQFGLGYMHHRINKKTQASTKLAPIHIWLGRLVIPLAAINAFIGFPFALSPNYDWILAVFVIIIGLPTALLMWWKSWRTARKVKKAALDAVSSSQSRSQDYAQPEYNIYSQSDINLTSVAHQAPYGGRAYGQAQVEPYSRV